MNIVQRQEWDSAVDRARGGGEVTLPADVVLAVEELRVRPPSDKIEELGEKEQAWREACKQ